MNYDITEEQAKEIVYNLPENYLNNYSAWFIVSYVCKRHDWLDLWEEWSMQSDKYDSTKITNIGITITDSLILIIYFGTLAMQNEFKH